MWNKRPPGVPIFVIVKLAIFILICFVFANTWLWVDGSISFEELFIFSLVLILYWVMLEWVVFNLIYMKLEVQNYLYYCLLVIGSFIISLPFFLIWDSFLWTFFLGRGTLADNLGVVLFDTPKFFYVQCFVIYVTFSLISLLWLHLQNYHDDDENTEQEQHETTVKTSSNGLKPVLTTKAIGKNHVIKIDTIIRIEANRYYARVIQEDSNHLLRESLESLDEKLQDYGFKRIHRSHIVNIAFLEKIIRKPPSANFAILSNGDKIPISRSRLKEFKQTLPSLKEKGVQ